MDSNDEGGPSGGPAQGGPCGGPAQDGSSCGRPVGVVDVPSTLAHLPHELLQPLPLFVYGTLMRGYGNHRNVVRGRHTHTAPALLGSGHLGPPPYVY